MSYSLLEAMQDLGKENLLESTYDDFVDDAKDSSGENYYNNQE